MTFSWWIDFMSRHYFYGAYYSTASMLEHEKAQTLV
jgi:hypothetical protein